MEDTIPSITSIPASLKGEKKKYERQISDIGVLLFLQVPGGARPLKHSSTLGTRYGVP